MKNDVGLISAAFGAIGGLLNALKRKAKWREGWLHVFVSAFLGFCAVQIIIYFFSEEYYTVEMVAAVSWIVGFFSNIFVPRLQQLFHVIFDAGENKIRKMGDCEIDECDVDKLKDNETNKKL